MFECKLRIKQESETKFIIQNRVAFIWLNEDLPYKLNIFINLKDAAVYLKSKSKANKFKAKYFNKNEDEMYQFWVTSI